MPQKLQFVWPKDGPKGRSGHRGFFGRMNNVLTNRGPDVFLQKKGSSDPILPEHWGNWDSYHLQSVQNREDAQHCSRGRKRYDPETRRYVDWHIQNDFHGEGVDGLGAGSYPRFTMEEWRKMARRLDQGRRINPRSMGPEWNHNGPRRFAQEHDWFWQEAHRFGENRREGLPLYEGANHNMRMHQEWPQDLNDWLVEAGLGRGPRRRQYNWPPGI